MCAWWCACCCSPWLLAVAHKTWCVTWSRFLSVSHINSLLPPFYFSFILSRHLLVVCDSCCFLLAALTSFLLPLLPVLHLLVQMCSAVFILNVFWPPPFSLVAHIAYIWTNKTLWDTRTLCWLSLLACCSSQPKRTFLRRCVQHSISTARLLLLLKFCCYSLYAQRDFTQSMQNLQ